mmetsp:Transcript_73360/g.184966  ORF Transcript_73360/g.184966 Transcript_73360/m.184966 type:complete len:95 (-) Transcript_73360:403-687(-)
MPIGVIQHIIPRIFFRISSRLSGERDAPSTEAEGAHASGRRAPSELGANEERGRQSGGDTQPASSSTLMNVFSMVKEILFLTWKQACRAAFASF